jgi:TPR repeat protein
MLYSAEGRAFYGMVFLFACFCAVFVASSVVQAKERHAFIIGVGDYNEKSGLPDLLTPVNDVQDIKLALQTLPQPFDVELFTDDQVKDKDAFQNAFLTFLSHIHKDDDVLFYFSGYGYNADKKNYYLLKTAKADIAFFKDLPPAEAKDLDTTDKKTKRYLDFIKNVALAEDEIEKAIEDREPGTLIIIADASRNRTDGSKGGPVETQGVILPARSIAGAYRLYSASEGQISLDSPEPVYRKSGFRDTRPSGEKAKPRRNSLFARVLVGQLKVPGQPLSVLAERVKAKVLGEATQEGVEQIPDYSDLQWAEDYFFWPNDWGVEQSALCQWSKPKLEFLRAGILNGALGRQAVNDWAAGLTRCDAITRQQVRVLRTIDALGTGTFASQNIQNVDASQLVEPQKICDAKGSSPVDADRQPISSGTDVLKLALAASAGGTQHDASIQELKTIADACEQAVTQRPLVARFKYNAGRVNYALATVTSEIERTVSLKKASSFYQKAADLGYAAAYNDLAIMIQNGDYYTSGPTGAAPGEQEATAPAQPDREAALKLLANGARLGHVVAKYNLGMAYVNGDLGLGKKLPQSSAGSLQKIRDGLAFEQISAAAEKSYVPAMIVTADYLMYGKGVTCNPDRAVEILSTAAYAGSWEAMWYLGYYYQFGWAYCGQKQSPSTAVLWYARAAEAGHVKSQHFLARMLEDGVGIPAPQPDAAGRYYRLAAYGGWSSAMTSLSDLLRDRKIPFRPVANRNPDSGALEIRTLYLAAFGIGDPEAGLSLGRLYRTGFPPEQGSDAIPKDPEAAITLLYRVIEKVNQSDTGSEEAEPRVAAEAAFELMSIYDSGEAKRKDGSPLISEDQILLLRQDYGDGGRKGYIRVGGIGEVACGADTRRVQNQWIMVWDWDRDDPPTESQLRWLERKYHCAENEIKQARDKNKKEPKPEDTGFTKSFREKIAAQYRAARDDIKKNGAKAKSFYDRMAELVSRDDGRSRRR